jgi:uncharacterized protein (TIGR02246 family)
MQNVKNAVAISLMLLTFISFAVPEDAPEQVFRDLENQIAQAVMTRNASAMSSLFTSDYMSVGVSGRIRSRAEIIDASLSGQLAISKVQTGKITVRLYGDTAIVVGLITVFGKDGSKDISGQWAFTRVYQRESGKWVAASFQATPVK